MHGPMNVNSTDTVLSSRLSLI